MSRATRDVRRLAIRAPNWVGDLAMATPVLAAAAADPRFERVDVLVRAPLAPLLAGAEIEPLVRPIASSRAEPALYRELAPHAALLLSNSAGAAWRAFRARVPVRAGAALSGRRLLLTHAVVPPARAGRRVPVPTAHLLRDVAGLLGIAVPDLRPRLAVPAEAEERARETLARAGLEPGRPYALCAPGAAFGASKLWPPARFAAALDALFEARGLVGVVTGGPREDASIEAVVRSARSPACSLAAFPRDLPLLLALVRGASLLLVGDSGPRWIAAAFGVPCVTVMGPNFPELTASSLERCRVVRLEHLECAPCLERRCPLGHHRCLEELPHERVVEAALQLLREREAASRAPLREESEA